MSSKFVLFLIVACLIFNCNGQNLKNKSLFKSMIFKIYQQLQTQQVQTNQDYSQHPFQFEKQKGLYGSEIHLNVIDKDNSFFATLMRDKVSVFDNNMFVTNFVISGLIETMDLGLITLDDHSFKEAIDALLTFKDKNQNNSTTPSYTFWTQVLVNGTWSAFPKNLESALSFVNTLPLWMKKIATLIGFDPKELAGLAKSFTIPPDNDDSGLNIALGSILRVHKDTFPEIQDKWESLNSDYKGYYASVKKYAYRPFNSIYHVNSSILVVPTKFIFKVKIQYKCLRYH